MHKQTNIWRDHNRDHLLAAIDLTMAELQNRFLDTNEETNSRIGEDNAKQLEFFEERMNLKPSMTMLTEVFRLSDFEQKILLVCAGIELKSKYAECIAQINGRKDLPYPTFNLLLKGIDSSHWDAITPASPLRKWNLIQLDSEGLLANRSIKIDEDILHYLTGFSFLEEELAAVIKEEKRKYVLSASQQNSADEFIQKLTNSSANTIELAGSAGGDKLAVAQYINDHLGFRLFSLDALALPQNTTDLHQFATTWNRRAALDGLSLYIDMQSGTGDGTLSRTVIQFTSICTSVVFVHKDAIGRNTANGALLYEVKKPKREEQRLLWNNLLSKNDGRGKETDELANRFDFSISALQAVAENYSKSTNDKNSTDLWELCCRESRPELENLAQRIKTLSTWDDIVLPDESIATLEEICMHVRYRSKVYREGGFDKKLSRGLGISALFSGESGTGKTMAAEVLANDLKVDLFRIDLSQVVNKYIGETEKNLKKIFDAAENSSAILLFDEADALFGKRNEVHDSHDRHSNLQIGYLLQRMENFSGLAILTTNMKNALDRAFERRIRFAVHFDRPNAAQRKEIWQKAFPNPTRVNGVDYEKLAAVNMPGGHIKNIALNAAFLAVAEDSQIGMRHLLKATKSEYKKTDKHLSNAEIKDWDET